MTLGSLLLTFLKLGALTFGGSVPSWVHREIVERRGWLEDKEFLSGLTVAQVLPGANPVNIALYVGLQLAGGIGAAIAVLGMVVPAFCLILLIGWLYGAYGQSPTVHFVLGGMAAAGTGATLNMAIKVTKRLPRETRSILIAAVTFVLVGLLRLPMVPVVLVAVPVSVFWAWRTRHGNA